MNSVCERFISAVRLYCEGKSVEAAQELSQLFGGSVAKAERVFDFLHIFLERDGASLVPVDESGVFIKFHGNDVSVRINFPLGNQLTVTFSTGEWR